MTNFDEYLSKQLQDPKFKKEYDALEPEYTVIQAMIESRKQNGMTQKELSKKTGITQSDISKIENGNANPSLHTLMRLAAGMGKILKIDFVSPTLQN